MPTTLARIAWSTFSAVMSASSIAEYSTAAWIIKSAGVVILGGQSRHRRLVAHVASGDVDVRRCGRTDLAQSIRDGGGGLARSAHQRDAAGAAPREVIAEFESEISGAADDEHMVGRGVRDSGDRVALGDPLRVQAAVAQCQLRFFAGVQRGEDPVRRLRTCVDSGRQIEVPESHARMVGADAAEARACRRVHRIRRRVVGHHRLAAHRHQPAVGDRAVELPATTCAAKRTSRPRSRRRSRPVSAIAEQV